MLAFDLPLLITMIWIQIYLRIWVITEIASRLTPLRWQL